MDTSDSQILFDNEGVCDHCKNFETHVKPFWHTDQRGRNSLQKIIQQIKTYGSNKDFDCIMGMSGGADSSYMLHLVVKEFGLRPLVFHVDGGWNSDVAVTNIQNMVDKLDLDLFTEVINWNEMRDFQLAHFKAGIPGIDIPQDHAFVATLYNFAQKHKIKYILNGGNFSTECVRNPLEFFYYGTDMTLIRDIRRQFCQSSMPTYPFSSILRHKIWLRYFKGVKVVKPLNYQPYIKKEAIGLLEKEYDWRSYGQKHFESRFTRFFEGYWLPRKFGFDPRRVQFSSLILTGQMTREEALLLLEQPSLTNEDAKIEFEYVAKKLEISKRELQEYMDAPNKSYRDYRNSESLFDFGAKVMRKLGLERSIKR
jgi:N-acetyl sugar amidotransferase